MKKYLVVKVKVDQDRNVTSILDVLFESYSYEKARMTGELYSYGFPLENDEYIAIGIEVMSNEICLN